MNIEITENLIKSSIVYALSEEFGKEYKYYDEPISQGFVKPSFHVNKIDNQSRKGYTGHQYKFRDDSYTYEIKYFSNQKDNVIEDINNKIDILKRLFDYLYIVNVDKDGNIYKKANRINSINVNISDGVLFFDIRFPIRSVQYLKLDKVKSNTLSEKLK